MLLRPALRALSQIPQIVTGYPLRPAIAARSATAPFANSYVARALCTNVGSDTEPAKMHMMFTCGKCDTRALKSFSKKSYLTGVVIATCPGCEAKHLIADNLGWFGEEKNIEEILAKKGVYVPVIDGCGEYAPPDSTVVDGADATPQMDVMTEGAAPPKKR